MTKNSTRLRKSITKKQLIIIMASCVLLTLTMGGYSMAQHRHAVQQQKAKEVAVRQAESERIKLQAAEALELEQEAKAKEQAEAQKQQTTDPAAAIIKDGKTSARPTASSKPGDLIGNNTTKQAKTYYGGPLVFSPQTVTISLSQAFPSVAISSSDGKPINAPSAYWDNPQNIRVGLMGGPAYGQQASWQMIVSGSSLTPGTYSVELMANTKNDIDTVEYSGRLTVVVVP
jgi:hypothetical protein